jgi:hypothetical protein
MVKELIDRYLYIGNNFNTLIIKRMKDYNDDDIGVLINSNVDDNVMLSVDQRCGYWCG